MGMWLLIHGGIKDKPCKSKGPQIALPVLGIGDKLRQCSYLIAGVRHTSIQIETCISNHIDVNIMEVMTFISL